MAEDYWLGVVERIKFGPEQLQDLLSVFEELATSFAQNCCMLIIPRQQHLEELASKQADLVSPDNLFLGTTIIQNSLAMQQVWNNPLPSVAVTVRCTVQ